jgi:hypothetical protein
MHKQQLDRLNSMTKYPSILTYHQLGERGRLEEHIQIPFDDDESVIVTEKVDGTNARIIFTPGDPSVGDYIIGSREELLHAKGDRIWIPTEGIVDTLKEHDIIPQVYSKLFGRNPKDRPRSAVWQLYHKLFGHKSERDTPDGEIELHSVWVVFGEVFGGKTGQAKQYTGKKGTGFRIFDVMAAECSIFSIADEMILGRNWDCQKISAWRQNGGQTFLSHGDVAGLFMQDLTPRLGIFKGKDIPKKHNDVLEWLQQFAKTQCRLDDGAKAKSEGVVIRNENRSKIAKIRFEDYERTLRRAK